MKKPRGGAPLSLTRNCLNGLAPCSPAPANPVTVPRRCPGPNLGQVTYVCWEYPVGSHMNRVYLDFNATTPVEPEVLDAMLPYFSGEFANAASIHTPGQKARAAVETAREKVAALIGARPQEIVFTSGGTESDNHAIFGIVAASTGAKENEAALGGSAANRATENGKHVITTAIEHEAVLNACQALEKHGVG